MAIITYPLNGIEYTAEDAETYHSTRTSGVFSSDESFPLEIVSGRTVRVGKGLAWINSEDFSGKSVCSTENIDLEFELSSAADRIDRIVLRFDKAQNMSEIAIKKGTPSHSPTAPPITQTALIYELGLYTVRMRAGAVAVLMEDITNTMLDESVCGVMMDAVTKVPTAQLQEQFIALLNRLQEEIENIEQGSDIMLKTVYDTDNDGVVDIAKTTQDINTKADKSGYTANRVIVSNNGGSIGVSSVNTTKLGYINGLTSDAQTQLNGKQDSLTFDANPTNGSNNPVRSKGIYNADMEPWLKVGDADLEITASHVGKTINISGDHTITLPVAGDTTFPIGGYFICREQGAGYNLKVLAPSGVSLAAPGVPFESGSLGSEVYLSRPYATMKVKKYALDSWMVIYGGSNEAYAGVRTITSNVSLNLSHRGQMLLVNSTSAVNVTVPTDATAFFPVGTEILVCRGNTGAVTVVPASGITLRSLGGSTASRVISEQNGVVCLKKLGVNDWLLFGALA